MLRAVGERDFSAQETAHMLKGLPLSSCTYSFVCILLDDSCAIQTETTSQDNEQLAQQPATNLSLCLTAMLIVPSKTAAFQTLQYSFVAKYTVYHGELQQRSTEAIKRTFPTYSSNPNGPTCGRYCISTSL